MEAVRIIKEMRRATHGKYPKFAVWENVPGAFSSNKGEDFRMVLEELIKIVEPSAEVPAPYKGRWPYADILLGDGWSVAYRVFDAQYWGRTVLDRDSGHVLQMGTPQRRRRIYLVADFTGECAGEILFKREGLHGDFAESGEEGQETATDAQGSPGTADRESTYIIDNIGGQSEYGKESLVNGTLRAGAQGAIAYSVENHPNDSRVNIDESGKCQTLTSRMGTGGGNVPMVMEPFCKSGRPQSADHATTWKHGDVANTLNTFDTGEARANELVVYALDRASFNQGQNAQYDPEITDSGVNSTIVARGPGAVAYSFYPQMKAESQCLTKEVANCVVNGTNPGFQNGVVCVNPPRYIVRRLTPTECARLQGFPDTWGHPPQKDSLTDEEYAFWQKVRNTHATINGREAKEYTEAQILSWYNKLHTDSSEYKMWGNGIALPNALYVMQGIAEQLQKETKEYE